MSDSEKLKHVFEIAKMNGLVKTQADFARLIGASDGTAISHAINSNGKYKAAPLLAMAENALLKRGISIEAGSNVQIGNKNINGLDPKKFQSQEQMFSFISDLWDTIKQRDEEIRYLRKIQLSYRKHNTISVLNTDNFISRVIRLCNESERFLFLCSPYFDLSDDILDAVLGAAQRGVHVYIIHRDINEFSIKNNSHSHVFNEEQRRLLKSIPGISIFYRDGLHAKTYFNDNDCIIGSMNLLSSSFANFELNISFDWYFDLYLSVDFFKSFRSILSNIQDFPIEEFDSYFNSICFK